MTTRAMDRLDGLRILLVEDEEDLRVLHTASLVSRGATVHAASCASEARKLMFAHEVDAIVSDIGLPDVEGHHLLRELRALDVPHAAVPAIALTGRKTDDDVDASRAAGFAVHLVKPCAPGELAMILNALHAGS